VSVFERFIETVVWLAMELNCACVCVCVCVRVCVCKMYSVCVLSSRTDVQCVCCLQNTDVQCVGRTLPRRSLSLAAISTTEQRRKRYAEQGRLYYEFRVDGSLYGVCVNATHVATPLTIEDAGVIWLRTLGRTLYPNVTRGGRDREKFFDSLGMEQTTVLT
jgi:hypothetical protein